MFWSDSALCPFTEFAKDTWSQLRQKTDIWPLKTVWTYAMYMLKSKQQADKLIITTPVWSASETALNDLTFLLPFIGKSFCCPSIGFKHLLDS